MGERIGVEGSFALSCEGAGANPHRSDGGVGLRV